MQTKKWFLLLIAGSGLAGLLGWTYRAEKPVSLFDGRTFRGWEGDTAMTWRIREGALVGGPLAREVPHNDFLCTTRS